MPLSKISLLDSREDTPLLCLTDVTSCHWNPIPAVAPARGAFEDQDHVYAVTKLKVLQWPQNGRKRRRTKRDFDCCCLNSTCAPTCTAWFSSQLLWCRPNSWPGLTRRATLSFFPMKEQHLNSNHSIPDGLFWNTVLVSACLCHTVLRGSDKDNCVNTDF